MKSLVSVSKNRQASLRTRLALGTALATIAFGYGGRGAYAGSCTVPSPSSLCSGIAGADVTQTLNAAGLSVTTSNDFGLTVGGGNALELTSTSGGLTFNDTGAGGSAITGFNRAINANNSGGGALTITTNGAVSNTTGSGFSYNRGGIYARNSAGAGDTTITTNSTVTTTAGRGIDVNTVGSSGSIIINANAAITAGTTGNAYHGIYAFAYSATSNITINTGAVSGVTRGIQATNNFNAATNIDVTVSGAVSGGSYGIQTQKAAGGTANVTLNSGASVSGGGDAILLGNNTTTNTLTVNSGASITGSVRMFGTDNVNFNGGDISGVTTITVDGTGTDSITFTNTGGPQTVSGAQLVGFQNFTVGSGGNVLVGGALNVTTVTAEDGGILGGTGTINANVDVTSGTLSAGNSPGLLNIVGNLDLGAASTTLAELEGLVAGVSYDQTDVTGIATLTAGATFDIDFFGVFTAGLGDVFDILVADSIVGDVGTLNFDFTNALLASGLEWDTSILDDGGRDVLRLTVQESIVMPEPSAIALFGASLLGLIGLRRRKKAA
jgi:fibronectin-binding autotransporter adhesin